LTYPTEKSEKGELVCIFLGLEFYTTPRRAQILKSKVADIILRKLQKEDLVAIDVQPAIDLTPTFTRIKSRHSKKKQKKNFLSL